MDEREDDCDSDELSECSSSADNKGILKPKARITKKQ